MRRSDVIPLQIGETREVGVIVARLGAVTTGSPSLKQGCPRLDENMLANGRRQQRLDDRSVSRVTMLVLVRKPTPPDRRGVFCVAPESAEQSKARTKAMGLADRAIFERGNFGIGRGITATVAIYAL